MRLQCSGCGLEVSEYAARCPACRRPADDAAELPEPGPAARMVAYPRPRPRRASAVAIGAALFLAAAIAVPVMSGPHMDGSPLGSLDGVVAAQSTTGTITWVDPIDGQSFEGAPLRGLSALDPLAVASDDSVVLDSSGSLLTIGVRRVTATRTSLTALLSDPGAQGAPTGFADGTRAVLVLTRSGSQSATASLVTLADGRVVALGSVDSAAGDPQSLGAFVSVPEGLAWPALDGTFGGDSRIELRMAGAAPIVLATTNQLERDVGWPPGATVRLDVYPNSLGDAVAVVLHPVEGHPGNVPMVILTRQGVLLAAMAVTTGPSAGSRPVWSPGGHQIAYTTSSTAGAAVVISTETGAAETYPAPAGTTFGSCIWSPASTDVLCQSDVAGQERWQYATTEATGLVSAPAVGDPLVWLAILPGG